MSTINAAGSGDVRLMAQHAMQKMSAAHEEDLRDVIDQIEANASKKAEIRELQRLVAAFEESVNQFYDNGETAADREKMNEALSELRTAVKDAGYGTSSDLYQATLAPDAEGVAGTGTYGSIHENSETYFGQLNQILDAESESLGDVGDQMQVRMQMAMTSLNTADKTASDILKAWGDSVQAIAANIKP